jgi:hypothetical protein
MRFFALDVSPVEEAKARIAVHKEMRGCAGQRKVKPRKPIR